MNSQNSAYGSAAGMGVGAGIGAMFGNPMLGAGLGGSLGGVVGGMMGGSDSPNFDSLMNLRDQELRQRRADINNFAGQLATSRQNYIANLQNLNRTSLNMFSPDLESQLGGKGIDIHGGAFSSALARASTQLNMSALQNVYGMEHQDLTNQMGLLAGQGSLAEFQAPLGMAQFNNQIGQQGATTSGMGMLAGSALNYANNKNLIASMAQLRTPTSNTQSESIPGGSVYGNLGINPYTPNWYNKTPMRGSSAYGESLPGYGV